MIRCIHPSVLLWSAVRYLNCAVNGSLLWAGVAATIFRAASWRRTIPGSSRSSMCSTPKVRPFESTTSPGGKRNCPAKKNIWKRGGIEAGWKVDYIITHCAPTSIQNELLREMPKPDELTDFQEEVLQRCRFQYHFFGHYHGDGIIQKQFVLLYDRFCD